MSYKYKEVVEVEICRYMEEEMEEVGIYRCMGEVMVKEVVVSEMVEGETYYRKMEMGNCKHN